MFCRKSVFAFALSIFGAVIFSGCVTHRQAAAQAHQAFLAGQNAALRQQEQKTAQTQGVTVVGPVQNPHVPWVVGLTLAQAVATANYTGQQPPESIAVITPHGLRTTFKASVLLNGKSVVLQPGDMVELH